MLEHVAKAEHAGITQALEFPGFCEGAFDCLLAPDADPFPLGVFVNAIVCTKANTRFAFTIISIRTLQCWRRCIIGGLRVRRVSATVFLPSRTMPSAATSSSTSFPSKAGSCRTVCRQRIVSPYASASRAKWLIPSIEQGRQKRVKFSSTTRPPGSLPVSSRNTAQAASELLKEQGCELLFRAGIHQKYTVIDGRIVWYGSSNLLSFGPSQESMMRLVSSSIARKLMEMECLNEKL